MKKLFLLLFIGICAQSVFAQEMYTVSGADVVLPHITRSASEFAVSPQGKSDTLRQYLQRGQGFTVYTYPVQIGGQNVNLPITGLNSVYMSLGTKYDFSGKANVQSLLVAYERKHTVGNVDTLLASVFSLDENTGLPSQQIGISQRFLTSIIDTTIRDQLFSLTTIPFSSPVPITKNFAVMVQTFSTTSGDEVDFTSIFSNQHGDGKGEKRACYLAVENVNGQPQLVAGNLADRFSVSNASLDIDPMIIPVLDIDTQTGVGEYPTLNGLTLKGAFPNPASEKTALRFSLEKSSFVDIQIIDMSGKVVHAIHREQMDAGDHSLDVDVTALPVGSYMYAVTTTQARFAATLTVHR